MFEGALSYLKIVTQKPESWVSLWTGTSHRAEAVKQCLNGRADVVIRIKDTPDQGPLAGRACVCVRVCDMTHDVCEVSQQYSHRHTHP